MMDIGGRAHSRGRKTLARVRAAVTAVPKTGPALAEELGLGRTTVDSWLKVLESEGAAVRSPLGWRVPFVVPAAVVAVMERFAAVEPLVGVWRRVPEVEEGEDDEGCDVLAVRFAAMCPQLGPQNVKVTFDRPWVDYHVWTALTTGGAVWNVDWTARQYHNLEDPPVRWQQSLPCPLVWPTEVVGYHPVLGAPATIESC
jgi:hypothetical protein